MRRLAERIDALAEKDERLIERAREIDELRRRAALALHGVCADFVREMSQFLSKTELKLDPPEFQLDTFDDNRPTLIQINARGRIVQVGFAATNELMSTEDFRVPYILEGAVHCFNQQLLEQDVVQEHLLFYCLERTGSLWRFFDERTYRSGPFDREYLLALLEQIV